MSATTAAAPLPPSAPVAVVGAGAMGAGIAQVAALAGHPVRLLDNRPGAAARAVDELRATLAKLAAKGKLDPAQADAAASRLAAVESLDGLADAALVVEAIVENLEAKRALFRDLEARVGEHCLFGTNTSSISVTAIAAGLARPERLAGLHFFNPAPLMALVEIVSGLATAPAVADTLFATAAAWGKTPVHARSTPGFIVNRVARPYYAEALRLVSEGAADTATLDALYREAGGFRMGPFELMDLIGHDVNFAVTSSVWKAYYHDPRFTPSLVQEELVNAGYLGRKSGRGFYAYGEGASTAAAAPVSSAAAPCPAKITLFGASPAANALAQRLSAAGVAHGRSPAADDGRLAEADGAVLYVTDGRTATRRAAESGVAATVLIDLALDYAAAPRLALACALQCPEAVRAAAIGLLQAAGFAVAELADVPGLALMRTVVMLANEAADAVNQGVCSPDAVDAAMRLGTNYPCGPLAWAERVGPAAVVAVLGHLAATYGEDRYRISPFLQQRVHAGKDLH
ncbi:3-hydroxyacyl-CoA dehydrogenase [Oryzomicrobium sp.]|uniref:3-hydroxyacyl-CoA dehydrogenase n=1 Tax=Oryzomicrobium sp. TaxID=1911578 RepID=UPI002FE2AC10